MAERHAIRQVADHCTVITVPSTEKRLLGDMSCPNARSAEQQTANVVRRQIEALEAAAEMAGAPESERRTPVSQG
jgi:hypothetical protein